MANRVALGALPGGGFGLRVSKPGFNVMDTGLTPQQIAFDSRRPSAARLHMEGTIEATVAGNITSYVTVSFGTTFAAPPPVLVLTNSTGGFEPAGWKNVDANWNGSWQNTSQFVIQHCRIYTDRIEFWRPVTGASRFYKYIIMRPF